MDTRALRYFMAVAETGHVTRAAEALGLTQSALSRALKALEREAGGPLLVRGGGRAGGRLTGRGLALHQRAREILALLDRTRAELDDADGPAGALAVGCVESEVSRLMAEAVGRIVRERPRIRPVVHTANGDELRSMLDRGDLDLALLLEPVEAAKYHRLRLPVPDRWGLLCPAGSKQARRAALGPEEVAGLPLILPSRDIVVDHILGWLGRPLESLRLAANCNLMTNATLLVRAGLGFEVCVEGAFAIRPAAGLLFRPFEPRLDVGHVLAWPKRRILPEAAQAFLEILRELVRDGARPAGGGQIES